MNYEHGLSDTALASEIEDQAKATYSAMDFALSVESKKAIRFDLSQDRKQIDWCLQEGKNAFLDALHEIEYIASDSEFSWDVKMVKIANISKKIESLYSEIVSWEKDKLYNNKLDNLVIWDL